LAGLQRVADVPIYATDGIVRRAESLQQTTDAQAPQANLSATLAEKLGVTDGATVRVTQGKGSVLLRAAVDASLPAQVVRVAAAHASTSALGAMFGAISVEKA
jgi:NADH-quinone oxidoreductase subunit G